MNSHLEPYLDLNGALLEHGGKTYKVHVRGDWIIYPRKEFQLSGSLEELDCEDAYCYTCLNDLETFFNWQSKLAELLPVLL